MAWVKSFPSQIKYNFGIGRSSRDDAIVESELRHRIASASRIYPVSLWKTFVEALPIISGLVELKARIPGANKK